MIISSLKDISLRDVRFADFSQVDMLGGWYSAVNFERSRYRKSGDFVVVEGHLLERREVLDRVWDLHDLVLVHYLWHASLLIIRRSFNFHCYFLSFFVYCLSITWSLFSFFLIRTFRHCQFRFSGMGFGILGFGFMVLDRVWNLLNLVYVHNLFDRGEFKQRAAPACSVSASRIWTGWCHAEPITGTMHPKPLNSQHHYDATKPFVPPHTGQSSLGFIRHNVFIN